MVRSDVTVRSARLHMTASSAGQLRLISHRCRAARAHMCSVDDSTCSEWVCLQEDCYATQMCCSCLSVWIRCRTIQTSGKAVGCSLFAAYAARQSLIWTLSEISVTGNVTERTSRERASPGRTRAFKLSCSLSLSPSLPPLRIWIKINWELTQW